MAMAAKWEEGPPDRWTLSQGGISVTLRWQPVFAGATLAVDGHGIDDEIIFAATVPDAQAAALKFARRVWARLANDANKVLGEE